MLAANLGPRYLEYDKLGVAVFNINNYQQAIDQLKRGEIAKAVFKMSWTKYILINCSINCIVLFVGLDIQILCYDGSLCEFMGFSIQTKNTPLNLNPCEEYVAYWE